LGAEVVPLGRYIVVAEQHQASLLAGHGVLCVCVCVCVCVNVGTSICYFCYV
jgi:hypothetical protein